MRRITWLLAVLMCGGAGVAAAQTFRMPCDVTGTIPALEDLKLPPEKADVEIQTMGKNIFLRLNGSKYYFVTVSSLSTDEFLGKNLTTAKEMGAWRKFKSNGQESEIRIAQATVQLAAYQDTLYQGRPVRVYIEGACTLPR